MRKDTKQNSDSDFIKKISIGLALGWLTVVSGLFAWQIQAQNRSVVEFAHTEAVGSFNKDLLYRRWATGHGGVYVPATAQTPPNPQLNNIKERDIVTPSGKQLTLVNPAYMTRQVHELAQAQYGVKGKITSLNLIRPENAPDAWEKKALTLFETGVKEVSGVADIHGEPHLRLMRPMVAEAGCLKCHGYQRYKVGDIRGGISVSVPMAQYSAIAAKNIRNLGVIYGVILVLGFGGIGGAFYLVGQYYRERVKAEERLYLAVNATRDGIWDWDITTNKEFVSPRWREIIGYTDDDPELHHTFDAWASRIHPDDQERVMEALRTHLEEQTPYDVKYRHRHRDGSYRWLQSRGRAVLDPAGRPVRMVGSISDINEDQELLQKLKESEERFRRYFELGSIGMAITSPDKGWVACNDYVCDLLGYSREDLLSSDWARMTHPDDLDKDLEQFTRMVEGHIGGYRIEKRFVHKEGHDVVTNLSVSGLRNPDGQVTDFLVTLEDITDRKRAEQELESYRDQLEEIVKERTLALEAANASLEEEVQLRKEAESLLKESQIRLINAIETIEDGFVLYDADDRLVLCNRKYREIYPKSSHLMVPGQRFEAILRAGAELGEYADAVGRVEAWVAERMVSYRKASSTIEQRLSDGTWLKITERRLANGDTVGVRMDVTHYKLTEEALRKIQEDLEDKVEAGVQKRLALEEEQRKMELRVQQAQKMESLGSLAGGIAHDFNNILFPIVGLAEILTEDLPRGSSEFTSALEIMKAGKRGSELVKQILAFSRQQEHKLIPTKVQQVVKEVIKLTRSTIPTNIGITHKIQPDCGLILGDAVQLHQIGMNLITNAYHAVEKKRKGQISIEVKEVDMEPQTLAELHLGPGKYARLSVTDNGIGIPQANQKKLFDPYFTTKEQGKGTGLGLAVVYGIVKEHKGDIRVSSELGEGTRFEVFLPLMTTEDLDAPHPEAASIEGGTEHILVVDDEEQIANLLVQVLERLGYRVSTRIRSLDALQAFKADPHGYDLVITDMSMPQMTGGQLAGELLGIRPDIPIIICTGFSEYLTRESALQLGVKGFLMKPILKPELAGEVRRVLDEVLTARG